MLPWSLSPVKVRAMLQKRICPVPALHEQHPVQMWMCVDITGSAYCLFAKLEPHFNQAKVHHGRVSVRGLLLVDLTPAWFHGTDLPQAMILLWHLSLYSMPVTGPRHSSPEVTRDPFV